MRLPPLMRQVSPIMSGTQKFPLTTPVQRCWRTGRRVRELHPHQALGEVMNNTSSSRVIAMNIIRYIGDRVLEAGRPLDQLYSIAKKVNAPSEKIATDLVDELSERGLVKLSTAGYYSEGKLFQDVNLSLDGWEQYETLRRGQFDGNYGFLAMEFNDDKLEQFVREAVKPTVFERLGVELMDMRDTARAGIIDDIMRVTIRDAKFVIADLTHDNNGAYWEAEYAEGLGKPTIYICEKGKFDEDETHFDVNHCTTVMWSADAPDEFRDELTAVLRRSLDL